MSQNHLTYEAVSAAAEKILTDGQQPTVEQICFMLKISGDRTELAGYLQQWIESQTASRMEELALLHGELGALPESTEQLAKTTALEQSLALVRSTLESTTDGILVVDKDNHIVDCNQKFIQMWGIPASIMQSGDEKAAFQFVLDQVTDPQGLYELVTKLYENEKEQGELGEVNFKDGKIFERYSQPHRVGDKIIGRVWSFRDVTARKRNEENLRLRQRAIESSVQGVLITDMTAKDNPIIYVNPAFEKMTGYAADELIGKNCRFLHSADRNQSALTKLRIAIREKREERVMLRNYKKDGSLFWNELFVSPVPNDAGIVTHYVGVASDVTERKSMEEQLLHQATHDSLTALPNRSLLLDRIAQAIIQAKRSELLVAIIFIDLDRFKLVNDSAGHIVGDELLKIAGGRLTECIRESDTLARMGGDEFVVVLNSIASEKDAIVIAEKLLTAMSQSFVVKQQEFTISASMGVSFYPKDATDATSLIKSADISMYQAKEHGRNTFKVFEEKMTHGISRRLELEANMRRALKNKEFVLYYQPLIDLKTNRIMGMEALMRWNDPEMGLIAPMDFIPIAEDDGLIIPLGKWALMEACEQLRAWQDMGFKNLEMAVNMSGKQLEDPDVIESVKRAFMGACIDPKFLEIELTETVLLDNAEEAIIKLQALKDLGVRLAIDDFGTGYSSLNYLKRFPVDKLKIDRSFIQDIMTDDNDKGIVRAVIGLADTLKLDVLAEGVETSEQLAFLRSVGCDQLQGFLFSKPIIAKEFTELLKHEKEQLAVLMK